MKLNFKRLLVANRSEIAIRIFRAASELGIRTVALYTEEDKLSLHRFKADEAYLVGRGPHLAQPMGPLEAYLSIDEVMRVAVEQSVDAIHPGYGFLSESPELAEACAKHGITFVGPAPATMRQLGNKISARDLAVSAQVPVIPATSALGQDADEIRAEASRIGYPLMLKASWGGGGRGMRAIDSEAQLMSAIESARREAASAFGKDEVYLEKLVKRARHVEVQILGDAHGNIVHLFERDCSIQRRNQKVVERAPAPFVGQELRDGLTQAALRIGQATNYVGAGTVEFLVDAETDDFYFIEVNPRVQVEHTITEVITGLDIVKAQIQIAQGGRIGELAETGIPSQGKIRRSGHAIQCRITTENPENGFVPDYGRITAYRGAMGFGIRIDGGTAYSGAVVTRFYDPLLEKVTAWAPSPEEAIERMRRALTEYRIRGVATNLPFLLNVVAHPDFRAASYTTRFIDETPELFDFASKQDRATRLMRWIADVTVNGHPDTKGRVRSPARARPPVPVALAKPAPGTRNKLDELGAAGFARWMKEQKRTLVTDTSMRDAHQSLFATRLRSKDILSVAPLYASMLPNLFSIECWGGATFDVAMRFLAEDPWDRLRDIRRAVPNVLTQMLLRGANGVGYTNYPDNVVQGFVAEAAAAGMDLFRIFDCLNWVENMRVSIDAVVESGKLAEGAICYTGDILDPDRAKYSLNYYVGLARELEAAGVHILGIKDMAGLLKPRAATALIGALKDAVDLPIHFHTHDTSGIAGATVLAAVEAGVDAVDAAMDALSGGTSQPTLGSIVAALKGSDRDTELDLGSIRAISGQWEAIRSHYSAFESAISGGASEVYLHEMPGGQFTNLKEQARAMGLEARWSEVAQAYASANQLFGDIVKVTPSSKVVGDMALMMVSQGVSADDVLSDDKEISFPSSVVEMMMGDLGQPVGGWPQELQRKVLGDRTPYVVRPGALMEEADLSAVRQEAEAKLGFAPSDTEFASYLMYPEIFAEYAKVRKRFGPVSMLPTDVFFYGMAPGEEINVEIERGKTLNIRLMAVSEVDREDGNVELFFELNGQPRVILTRDKSKASSFKANRKAADEAANEIGAPMPGTVTLINVKAGDTIRAGEILLVLEAMKMETAVRSPSDGVVAEVVVTQGLPVDAKDLLVTLEG